MSQCKRVGKRLRTRKSASARVAALTLDMEVPLNDATDAAQALRFIGYGLAQQVGDDEGRAVAAIAWTAGQRLDAVPEIWRSLCRLATGKNSRRSPLAPHCLP